GFMHQIVVASPAGENLGAFLTMKADDGGQSPGITRSSWMVTVPVCRSGRSELTGTWRIDHSMSYVPTSGPSWAQASPLNVRTIASARIDRLIICRAFLRWQVGCFAAVRWEQATCPTETAFRG